MGFFGRIRDRFNEWVLRRGESARERIKGDLDKEDMNEKFTNLTKKIVDGHNIGKDKAIKYARKILETPEEELEDIDLDILEDY